MPILGRRSGLVGISGSAGGGGPTLVQTASLLNNTGTTHTITPSSMGGTGNPTAGNIAIVFAKAAQTMVGGFTPNTGTWTTIATNDNVCGCCLIDYDEIFVHTIGSSETSYQFSTASGYASLVYAEYSGLTMHSGGGPQAADVIANGSVTSGTALTSSSTTGGRLLAAFLSASVLSGVTSAVSNVTGKTNKVSGQGGGHTVDTFLDTGSVTSTGTVSWTWTGTITGANHIGYIVQLY